MNKLIGSLLIIVFLVAIPMMAQELPQGDPRNSDFRAHWTKVMAANPSVPNFYRMPVGAEYWLPNGVKDWLVTGDTNGIWGREFQKWYGIPYNEFLKGQAPKPVSVDPPQPEIKKVVEVVDRVPGWLWLFILFLTAVMLYAIWLASEHNRRRRSFAEQAQRVSETANRDNERLRSEIDRLRCEADRRREPEQLGPPVVAGGIQPTETEKLQNFFRDQAVFDYAAHHPGLSGQSIAVQATLVGPIQHGMLFGESEVQDANGNWHESLIVAPGRPGYQARFRYPDGTETVMQSYQACMNPVRAGQRMRGYTFVPDTVITEPALSENAVVPPPATPPTTPEVPAITKPALELSDENAFMMRRQDGRPNLIKLDSSAFEEFYFARDGNITLRYREVVKMADSAK